MMLDDGQQHSGIYQISSQTEHFNFKKNNLKYLYYLPEEA